MSFILWCIEKYNINNNIIMMYNIKRNEIGLFDKIDNKILKKFSTNINEANYLIKKANAMNVETQLIERWSYEI